MSFEILKNIVLTSTSKTAAKREKNIAKGNPTAWRKAWEDALRIHYPESVVQYTDRVQSHLKLAIEKRGLPFEDMVPFIRWIVANWERIRGFVFSFNPKSPRGPLVPDMKTVVSYLTQVHALYMQQKPEINAAIPLAARRIQLRPAPVAVAPKTAPKHVPAPLKRHLPPVVYKPDQPAAEAARIRNGFPKWDDK